MTNKEYIQKEEDLCRAYSKAFKGSKQVLADLDDYCGINQNPFDENDRREAYKLGMQDVIRYIHNRISGIMIDELQIIEEAENG